MGKHYGQVLTEKVLEMKKTGKTHGEIAEQLGFTHQQINGLVKRENIRKRKIAAGIALKRKGRPSKNCVVTEQDKVADLRYKLARKEYHIKQLEMENELMRDFLKETERG